MSQREIPKRSELVDFTHAVAGHAGTLCDTDGFLFIKPCTQSEIDFYETARAQHEDFASLIPTYIGSLMLNDPADAVSTIAQQLPAGSEGVTSEVKQALAEMQPPAPVDSETWTPRGSQSIVTDRAVVLQNVTFGYEKPNVLDVKLGQRLWADNAPRQKRARMDEVRASTTHESLGFRISGMRVFRGADNSAELDATEYKTYDKDYGRYDVNTENVIDAFRNFICNKAAGIDEDLARTVAASFKEQLEHVRDVLEKERTRIYSSSLLLVFEGDGAALRERITDKESLEHNIAAAQEAAASTQTRSRRDARTTEGEKPTARSTSRTDSGIVIEDGDLEDDFCEDDLSVDSYEEGDSIQLTDTCLIDFAHARFCSEEEEPDENSLIGVRSLIRIFAELAK